MLIIIICCLILVLSKYFELHFLKCCVCIYSWLCWVFTAVGGLSLVVACGETLCCGVRASHYGGFSYYRPQALGCVGFGSCGTWV